MKKQHFKAESIVGNNFSNIEKNTWLNIYVNQSEKYDSMVLSMNPTESISQYFGGGGGKKMKKIFYLVEYLNLPLENGKIAIPKNQPNQPNQPINQLT